MTRYGLVRCALCKRPRIVDLSTKESSCPGCQFVEVVSKMTVDYESRNQANVRTALVQATSADGAIPTRRELSAKKRKLERTDLHSTMVYQYEHASSPDEKMTILSDGLSKIKGEFTLEDVLEVDPKRGEKYLKAMLEQGYVYEVSPGRFTK